MESLWVRRGKAGVAAAGDSAELTDFDAPSSPSIYEPISNLLMSGQRPQSAWGRVPWVSIARLAAISIRLSVAVIDNRRPMLSVMRAMLAAIGIGRIETYESPIRGARGDAQDGSRPRHRRGGDAALTGPRARPGSCAMRALARSASCPP